MAGKWILGTLLAALALMVWGFFAWALTAGAMGIVQEVPGEQAVGQSLQENLQEDGAYFLPQQGFRGSVAEQGEWRTRHVEGPLALIFYRRGGVEPSPAVMLGGFLHFWFSALLAAALLWMARSALPGYWARVKLVTVAGIFAGVALHLSPSVWWYVPWSFSLYSLWATAVGWMLAGMVLAFFVKE